MLTYKETLEVILIDEDEKKVLSNVMDLEDALFKNKNIRQGSYQDIDDASILVIACGIPYKGSRNEFLKKSHMMIKNIMDKINKTNFRGHILVVSNPNDVLTTYVAKNYYDYKKVIGTGTSLDSNRLKRYLSNKFRASFDAINSLIVGEHGNSQVIVWDEVYLEGKCLQEVLSDEEKNNISCEVIERASLIVQGKGYTNYGVANCLCELIKTILEKKEETFVASSYDKEEDIAYSTRVIFSNDKLIRENNLREPYKTLLKKSIEKIKKEYQIFENKKNIGIDLDDTITFLYDVMNEEAIKFNKDYHIEGVVDNTKYLAGEKYGWTKEQRERFFKGYRPNAIAKARVRENAQEVITKLMELGYQVTIITARSPKYYKDPYNETLDWLQNNHIPFTKLIVDSSDKKTICQNESIDIFVDDMPSNCEEVATLPHIKVYMMDNVNNKCDSKKVTKIQNFNELYEVIINE